MPWISGPTQATVGTVSSDQVNASGLIVGFSTSFAHRFSSNLYYHSHKIKEYIQQTEYSTSSKKESSEERKAATSVSLWSTFLGDSSGYTQPPHPPALPISMHLTTIVRGRPLESAHYLHGSIINSRRDPTVASCALEATGPHHHYQTNDDHANEQ